MDSFIDLFQNADHEWAYAVDEQGYVHGVNEGGSTSVTMPFPKRGTKGLMMIHNHPGTKANPGGAFSDKDLINASMTKYKGIIATDQTGEYIFQKGTHFKATDFVSAVKRAKLKGKDYNDAARKWLKANAKKYGYKFEYNTKRNYVANDKTGSTANKQGKQVSVGGKQYRVTSVQKDMTGKSVVLAAKVFQNGKWTDAKMTKSLSGKLADRYNSRG